MLCATVVKFLQKLHFFEKNWFHGDIFLQKLNIEELHYFHIFSSLWIIQPAISI